VCVCVFYQILALFDAFDSISVDSVVSYVSNLQQNDGSFYGDKWGEVDTRFSFCAIACLALLVRFAGVFIPLRCSIKREPLIFTITLSFLGRFL